MPQFTGLDLIKASPRIAPLVAGLTGDENSTSSNTQATPISGVRRYLKERPDPQLSFQWRVDFGTPLVPPYYAENLDLPLVYFESEGKFRNATRTYYPTFSDINGITIQFYEDRHNRVLQGLLAWKGLIQNADGTYNMPSTYKKSITVTLLGNNNEDISSFELIGCWPKQTTGVSLVSNASDRVIPSCEFSVDGLGTNFHFPI